MSVKRKMKHDTTIFKWNMMRMRALGAYMIKSERNPTPNYERYWLTGWAFEFSSDNLVHTQNEKLKKDRNIIRPTYNSIIYTAANFISYFHNSSISSSSSSPSLFLRILLKSTKWRIVGLPCGQFQGDFRNAKCSNICRNRTKD